MKTFVGVVAASVVCFGAGLLVGRGTAPTQVLPSGQPFTLAPPTPKTGQLPEESRTKEAERAAELKQRRLADWQNDPRAQIAQSLAGWIRDPAEAVGTLIDGMSDDEIRVTLTSLTNLKNEDLNDVRDLRQYARRLAEIAAADLIGRPSFRDPQLPEVYFSRDPNPEEAVELRQTEFAGNGRMHAILPMNDYNDNQVFVKWTRIDDGEVMLFDTYPIRKNADYNWVYLEPRDGWTPGEYSVDFYTRDEAMQPLAGSNFVVK